MRRMTEIDRARFDELSAQVAAAYVAGDLHAARHTGDLLCAHALFPRFRRLSFVRGFVPELREDVVAHALMRVASDWRRGKQVKWATLERIFVNAAVDMTRQYRKVPLAHAGDDEDAREAFYAAEGVVDGAPPDELGSVLDQVEADELAARFEGLGRPAWAAYVRAWHSGYRTGPDIEHATGIKAGRVRQIRMDMCHFLHTWHPDVAPRFGCIPVATHPEVKA